MRERSEKFIRINYSKPPSPHFYFLYTQIPLLPVIKKKMGGGGQKSKHNFINKITLEAGGGRRIGKERRGVTSSLAEGLKSEKMDHTRGWFYAGLGSLTFKVLPAGVLSFGGSSHFA